MRLFSNIRENLQKNRGTLAQKLMGGMGLMERMPEGMRPRRGEGIVQGMFPRLDKRRMGRMPSIEELVRFARENNLPLPPGLKNRFPINEIKPGVIIEPEVGVGVEPPIVPPPLPPRGEDMPDVVVPLESGSRGSGIDTRPMPMMPPTQFRPKPPSKGMPIDPGRMPRFEGGGSVYPNKGLAALAKVAPEVVKRMGYKNGGDVTDSSPFREMGRGRGTSAKLLAGQRTANTLSSAARALAGNPFKMSPMGLAASGLGVLGLMALQGDDAFTLEGVGRGIAQGKIAFDAIQNEIKSIADTFGTSVDEALQKIKNGYNKEIQASPGRTLSRQDRIIAAGMAEPLNEIQNFPRRDAQMMIDELMDSIQNGSPEQMAEKSFLLDRLQELDLSPEQQNQVFVISRMLKERNIPVGGMKVTETSVEMMPGERGRTISNRDRDIISGFIPPTEPPIQKMLEQMNTR